MPHVEEIYDDGQLDRDEGGRYIFDLKRANEIKVIDEREYQKRIEGKPFDGEQKYHYDRFENLVYIWRHRNDDELDGPEEAPSAGGNG